ncbi:retrovirus-related pol polyprotein from transposon TNT 1-94 [Tanacetum coccineum]
MPRILIPLRPILGVLQQVSPVDINPISSSADEEGGTTIFGCENDASIQKSNGLATLEKEMETRVSNKTPPCETVKSVGSKKVTISIRKDSSGQDSQSQENVSPLLVLPQKSTIIALGTVYKTNGKQMLRNKELPKDCYKVSIDTSLVDATCIPDVGNNSFKTVKDAVVFDTRGLGFLQATPPSTIQMNVENKTAPKMSPVDRIFVRMGAKDHIMAGESTFLTELLETASTLLSVAVSELVLGRVKSRFIMYLSFGVILSSKGRLETTSTSSNPICFFLVIQRR